MAAEQDIKAGDWTLHVALDGSRVVGHEDGTVFICDRARGLSAYCLRSRCLPPELIAWLVQEVLDDENFTY